jgi:hypothetical protein
MQPFQKIAGEEAAGVLSRDEQALSNDTTSIYNH